MASIDAEVVKHALQVARDHGFAEVELANGETQFRASLEVIPRKRPRPEATDSDDVAGEETTLLPLKSSYVGYLRLDGGKLEVGQVIAKGDVVASVATLGLANELESSVTGEIVEVFVMDGDPVQFGQVLAQVKP